MWATILLLNPIYVTLFWALELSLNRKDINYPKVFLGKYMMVAFVLYSCYFIYYYRGWGPPGTYIYYYVDSIFQLSLFLLFPLYYVYVRLLTVDKTFSWKKHYKYFILPAIVFVMYAIGNFSITKEEHYEFLYFNSDMQYTGSLLYFAIIYHICRMLYLVQSIILLGMSYVHIKRNKDHIYNYYANTDEDSLDKISIINIAVTTMVLIYIFISYVEKEFFINAEKWGLIPALISTCMLFLIGWLGNRQKSVVIENISVVETDDSSVQNEMNSTQLDNIRDKIECLFNNEKVYLNRDLTLWELSRLVGTNRTYISMVINSYYNQNFSTFVNSYRAKHAQELLQKNPELSNPDLASLSGFGSVISMQRAFQTIEGKTIRQIKTEL